MAFSCFPNFPAGSEDLGGEKTLTVAGPIGRVLADFDGFGGEIGVGNDAVAGYHRGNCPGRWCELHAAQACGMVRGWVGGLVRAGGHEEKGEQKKKGARHDGVLLANAGKGDCGGRGVAVCWLIGGIALIHFRAELWIVDLEVGVEFQVAEVGFVNDFDIGVGGLWRSGRRASTCQPSLLNWAN